MLWGPPLWRNNTVPIADKTFRGARFAFDTASRGTTKETECGTGTHHQSLAVAGWSRLKNHALCAQCCRVGWVGWGGVGGKDHPQL